MARVVCSLHPFSMRIVKARGSQSPLKVVEHRFVTDFDEPDDVWLYPMQNLDDGRNFFLWLEGSLIRDAPFLGPASQ